MRGDFILVNILLRSFKVPIMNDSLIVSKGIVIPAIIVCIAG